MQSVFRSLSHRACDAADAQVSNGVDEAAAADIARRFQSGASGRWFAWAGVCAVVLLSGCSDALHLSFLDPQGPIAAGQEKHFYEAMAVLLIFVALPVFVLAPFFFWRYRFGAKNKARYTPGWDYSRLIEIGSWAGPIAIVLMLSVIVWRDTHALDPYKPLASDQPPLRVQAIGYDWKWLFVYPDEGIASIGTLRAPVGRPIALELTSATVMQSLHIPAWGSQIYAMGGMVTQLHLQADKPGSSLGENNMYNGDGFHQQRFVAVAMPAQTFASWTRQVHAQGSALDAKTLQAIGRRSTKAELAALIGARPDTEGGLNFSGASAQLFPSVVHATMSGEK